MPTIFQPVPDPDTDIQLIVKDACAADEVTVYGVLLPVASARTWNTIGIQIRGDIARRLAIGILRHNAPYDRSLMLDNEEFALDPISADITSYVVSVGLTSCALPVPNIATQPSAYLMRDTPSEFAAHKALQSQRHRVHSAFLNRMNRDIIEVAKLIKSSCMFGVSHQAVDILSDNDINAVPFDRPAEILIGRAVVR